MSKRSFRPAGAPFSYGPRLARLIASDLASGRKITNPRVLERFDVAANPSLGGRVQTLAARLRARSSGSA
jgi:hypothetical protein